MANGKCPTCYDILTLSNATPSTVKKGAGPCNSCHNKWARNRYKENPKPFQKKNKRSRLKCRYQLTQEEYDNKYKDQNGLCAICKKPETLVHSITGKILALAVDHSHITGQNRDLLCHVCNLQIVPIFELYSHLFPIVMEYLKKHNDN